MRHTISVSKIKPLLPRAVFEAWWREVHKDLPRGDTRILRRVWSIESSDSVLGKLSEQRDYMDRVEKREIMFDPDKWQAVSDEKIGSFSFDCPLAEQVEKIAVAIDNLDQLAPSGSDMSWDTKMSQRA